MRVTIQDVARRAGVSPMTVSRVVNASPRVSPETRRRVEDAIAELGYVPNRLAQGLTGRRSGALGLIVPDVANPFFTNVVHGAEDAAWRAGYRVILCNTQADLERERGYIEDMHSFRVEGVLLAPVSDRSRANLNVLIRNGVPFVLVDRSLPGASYDLVQGDSVAAARQIVEHLIRLGHRRIGMIAESLDVSTSRERVDGYRRALKAARVRYDPKLVVARSTATDPRTGIDGAAELLELPDPPTAIFAVNNVVAVGVAEAARARGREIPGDVALVCVDDLEFDSRIHPFLTVMAQPAQTFGSVAMQLLLDRIAGRAGERRRNVVLPADLIVRESCGADGAAAATGVEAARPRSARA
jgi:LacI family transcriptional regulator